MVLKSKIRSEEIKQFYDTMYAHWLDEIVRDTPNWEGIEFEDGQASAFVFPDPEEA